jgi:glycosyltransferase involved in cell wall biosynthesis
VDDGSRDGAAARLAESGARLIRFAENRGKGFALLEGFRTALAIPEVRCCAVVDADGQHDPSDLPGLYETMVRESADLVIGSRSFTLAQVPWRSRLGNRFTAFTTRVLLGQAITDTQSGYRLHSRRLLEFIVENVPGGRYETEMEILARSIQGGFRVVQAPIQTIYEAGNPSSHFHKLRDSLRILWKLIAVSVRR